ncbi:MAG TPA: TadE family protein [Gemmataceae bacterium]|jgi:Flp pilus assembly protein TadG|nr:TadE family protein [Gemmataceae bacterium]
MLLRHSKKTRRPGAAMVEFAFAFSALVVILFALFEFSFCIFLRQVSDNAAREGARLAVVADYYNPPLQTSDIQNRVKAVLPNSLFNSVNVQVYLADSTGKNIGAWPSAKFGQNVVVQVDAVYSPLFPTFGLFSKNVNIGSRSMMRSEAP